MVEHRNDQKLIAKNAIDHRKRKPAKQHPTAVASDGCKHVRISHGGGYSSIQSPCEFKAKTCSAGLIPSLRLKCFVSGLGPKENMHSVIALEQFSAHLIPRNRTRRVLRMLFQPGLYRVQLVRRQSHGFRAFRGDAVPDVFRELDPFSDGEAEKIGSGLAHG